MTNTEWITLIQGMTVSGVSLHYDYPPESVDTSGGPIAFPALPVSERGEPVSTCADMSKQRAIDYVVVVSPVGQGDNESNYAQIPALLDALEDAFDNLTTAGFVEYTIRASGNYSIGGVTHWALIASVTWRAA